MMEYFKASGIKMRQIDPDTKKGTDLDDINSEDIAEEIKQSQDDRSPEKGTVGRSGRRRIPVAGAASMPDLDSEMDEEDSDDESFGDQGSDDGDDEEDGEEDQEDDIDDYKIGKEELAHLTGEKATKKKKK